MKLKNLYHVLMMFFVIWIPTIAFLSGCSQAESKQKNNSVPNIYICTQTGDFFTGPGLKFPALHPRTGEKTLQRALYCKHCQTWHAVPPLAMTGGNQGAVKCEYSELALESSGPVPKNALKIKDIKETN